MVIGAHGPLGVAVQQHVEMEYSENDIEQLLVGLPDGGTAPLLYVADVTRGRSPTEITREEGRRTVTVSGELAPGVPSSRPRRRSWPMAGR